MGTLDRLATAGRARAVVADLTRDPDPATKHRYRPDPQSGAGNCVCGMAKRHRRHRHDFLAANADPKRCTCGLPAEARCHRPTADDGTGQSEC